MLTLGQQKTDTVTVAIVAVGGAILTVLSLFIPGIALPIVLGLTGLGVVIYAALRWEINLWTWVWVLSYGMLDRGFWHQEVAGFFNLTAPRIIFMLAMLAYGVYFIVRNRLLHLDRSIFWWLAALVIFCAISATRHGWSSDDIDFMLHPYYRFIGGMIFPFAMFFLMYNTVRTERQYKLAIGLLSLFSWYVIFVAYVQYLDNSGVADLRRFIWPGYINDPDYGIHFARSRGPFIGTGPQAMLLVVAFYGNLFLMRQIRSHWVRALLIFQMLLILPAVLFTGLRAGYVAFLLCAFLWVAMSGRWLRVLKVLSLLLILLLLTWAFWTNLAQEDRTRGGVAQGSPIKDRIALARISYRLVQEHPLAGVGYGRFAEGRRNLPHDPTIRALPPEIMQHNIFLGMAAETGVVGLILFGIPFAVVFRESLRLYRKLPPEATGPVSRRGVVLFWIALTNYLVSGMFGDVTVDFFGTGLFWSLAGLIIGYNRLLEPQPINAPEGLRQTEPIGATA